MRVGRGALGRVPARVRLSHPRLPSTAVDARTLRAGTGVQTDMASHHNHRNRLWHLQRVKLFESLSDAERRIVHDASQLIDARRRQRLYMPGDPSNQLFVLRSGIIKLSVINPQEREIILGFLHPGDMFGELAVVDDDPRDHIAEAYEDAVVYGIDRDVFRRLMHESRALSHEITKLLGIRLRTYRTRVEELLFKSAHARVAHTLLDLAGQHGVPDAEGVVIPLRLSQRDIANLVGLTRETVNFILEDLRRRNLIETQGRSIRVRAPEVLHAVR